MEKPDPLEGAGMNIVRAAIVTILAALVVGCSGPPAPVSSPSPAAATATPTPEETVAAKRVFFVDLADGAEVKSPVVVAMGVEGMEVKPAGENVPNSGHHHIVIDGSFVPEGEAVPADENHIHFGTGATEATLELPPGDHTLTLQFADYLHKSYGEPMSATIKVKVVE